MEIAKWMGNQWKEKFMKITEKYCCKTLQRYFKPAVILIGNAVGIPNPDKCPFPPVRILNSLFLFGIIKRKSLL